MNNNPVCEDAPCCGCCGQNDGELPDDFGMPEMGDDMNEFPDDDGGDDEPHGSHDLSDDGDALASAGMGTDEDYGYFGGDEY
jgi:hypothetical protein